jgi:AmiR/NasT family two-component response regulator
VSYGFVFAAEPSSRTALSGEVSALHEEIRQLRNAGNSRHEIGIAQGMLMLRDGIDQDQAYAKLSLRCKKEGVHVRAVAQAVVTEMRFPGMSPEVRPL